MTTLPARPILARPIWSGPFWSGAIRSSGWLLLTGVLLIGLLQPIGAWAAPRPPIILAADRWCPYNCDPDSEQPGYVIELAREVFGAAGYPVIYRSMPWARALQSVQAGEVTGVIGATRDELPMAVFPQQAIGQFHGTFFLPRGSSWRYGGAGSLDGLRLGLINSYDYGAFNTVIAAKRESDQLLLLSGDDAVSRGLGMLARGRLDAFLEDRNVADYTLRSMGLNGQVVAGDSAGPPLPLFLAFSNRHPQADQLAEILSLGIQNLRSNGRLASMLARYGVRDWIAAAPR